MWLLFLFGRLARCVGSVPLRGYGFEIVIHMLTFKERAATFPSPCGGSSCLASPVATGEVASNASRWGRLCLAFISDTMKVYSLRPWRPLHRLRGPSPPLWQGRLEVHSVPLRGYGFEMARLECVRAGTTGFPSPYGDMVLKLHAILFDKFHGFVSVPLRGYGFEISSTMNSSNRSSSGFRPLAGIWF